MILVAKDFVPFASKAKALSTGALVKPETLKRLVVSARGASAVFAMTPNDYTVIVLANIGAAAQPVADRILKLIGG